MRPLRSTVFPYTIHQEHPFQEKKSQSQNSIQHFEFSDARCRLGKVQSNAEIIPSFIKYVCCCRI